MVFIDSSVVKLARDQTRILFCEIAETGWPFHLPSPFCLPSSPRWPGVRQRDKKHRWVLCGKSWWCCDPECLWHPPARRRHYGPRPWSGWLCWVTSAYLLSTSEGTCARWEHAAYPGWWAHGWCAPDASHLHIAETARLKESDEGEGGWVRRCWL